jgi:hypothetical protein
MMIPADILTDAKILNDGATSEARRRAVVSRAYYAVYHHILSQPWAKEFTDELRRSRQQAKAAGRNAPGAHSLLVRWLAKHPNRTLKYAGAQLDDLKGWRVVADYYLLDPIAQFYSANAIKLADEIIYVTLAELDGAA